ncbi:MAG: XylR family transcriptional regulator [Phycisphaerae bacterium]
MNSIIRATSGRFLRVAVMLSIERNYAREILRGVERYCVAQPSASPGARNPKWHLAVYPLTDIVWSRTTRRKMREWGPDGIIAQISSQSLARFCAGFKKPVVQLMHPTVSSGFPRVGLDDLAVGGRAAEYFLQKGYRSFAYCGLNKQDHFDPPWLRWNELRQEGYVEAINDFFKRLPGRTAVVPQISIFSDDTPATQRRSRNKTGRNTERQIEQWLTTLPPRTAIFCGCDYWAGFLLRAAGNAQLQVPDHIAVLGVDDDILFCQLVDPPLSSIMTGDDRVGREAAKLLDAMLAGGAAPTEPILLAPLGVTERQSSNITTISDADVSAALNYIKKHALDNLSVKTLMAHLPVNRRTLEMKFQRILGRSPADEVHRVRLEHLKMLLRTDLSIGQIVRRMNYSSSQYLARTFRRDTGMSLTQYRRTIARSL